MATFHNETQDDSADRETDNVFGVVTVQAPEIDGETGALAEDVCEADVDSEAVSFRETRAQSRG